MSKKLKYILAVSLLWVFLLPTTVKLLDSSFHHHVVFHSRFKADQVWHTYHHTCPIPGFTLSFYTFQHHLQQEEKRRFCSKIVIALPPEHFRTTVNSSVLLRAPPLSDKNS
jgi:hypothetical protein